MAIFSKTVKLEPTIDIYKYTPPVGIDVNWKLYNNELYATFSGGNRNQEKYVRDKSDINATLSKLKVISDTIRDYKTYRKVVPQGHKMITWHDDGNGLKEYK